MRTGVEASMQSAAPRGRGSPCANRGRRSARSAVIGTARVSLCEQGSKGLLRPHLPTTAGLPVRTGVEGGQGSSWPRIFGSPCANRGRRRTRVELAANLWFSLCEQGSKEALFSSFQHARGLPVRTGVEGWATSVRCATRGSPCANRGRRTSLPATSMATGVSLCEQGSKVKARAAKRTPKGLPVRTGVEEKREGARWRGSRSPCANRGRRHASEMWLRWTEVSLCEQGSKPFLGVTNWVAPGLPVRTGVEGWPCDGVEQRDGSPCANRGRREIIRQVAGQQAVSLCEQGSKARGEGCVPSASGLPVRTGVEGKVGAVAPRTCRFPCSNRVIETGASSAPTI